MAVVAAGLGADDRDLADVGDVRAEEADLGVRVGRVGPRLRRDVDVGAGERSRCVRASPAGTMAPSGCASALALEQAEARRAADDRGHHPCEDRDQQDDVSVASHVCACRSRADDTGTRTRVQPDARERRASLPTSSCGGAFAQTYRRYRRAERSRSRTLLALCGCARRSLCSMTLRRRLSRSARTATLRWRRRGAGRPRQRDRDAGLRAGQLRARAGRAGSHLTPPKRGRCSVLAQVQGECPQAGAESPQDAESTQMSNEVIGAMVMSAIAARPAGDPDVRPHGRRPALEQRRARPARSTRTRRKLKTMLTPCRARPVRGREGVGARAATTTLPASTVSFVAQVHARVGGARVSARRSSARYESGAKRRRWPGAPCRLEEQLTERRSARGREHWGDDHGRARIWPVSRARSGDRAQVPVGRRRAARARARRGRPPRPRSRPSVTAPITARLRSSSVEIVSSIVSAASR